jgi:hypothetical protein
MRMPVLVLAFMWRNSQRTNDKEENMHSGLKGSEKMVLGGLRKEDLYYNIYVITLPVVRLENQFNL